MLNGQARLDHYNQWLLDSTRDITSVYPGFPEGEKSFESKELDTGASRMVKKSLKIKELAPVDVTPKASIMKISKQGNDMKVTKLARARDIVGSAQLAGLDKNKILAELMTALGISRGNAFVYFTKVSHVELSTTEAAEPKATPAKTAKASKKSAAVEATIAKARSAGADPFAQLVASVV